MFIANKQTTQQVGGEGQSKSDPPRMDVETNKVPKDERARKDMADPYNNNNNNNDNNNNNIMIILIIIHVM